jgi:hypothetical protein
MFPDIGIWSGVLMWFCCVVVVVWVTKMHGLRLWWSGLGLCNVVLLLFGCGLVLCNVVLLLYGRGLDLCCCCVVVVWVWSRDV